MGPAEGARDGTGVGGGTKVANPSRVFSVLGGRNSADGWWVNGPNAEAVVLMIGSLMARTERDSGRKESDTKDESKNRCPYIATIPFLG